MLKDIKKILKQNGKSNLHTPVVWYTLFMGRNKNTVENLKEKFYKFTKSNGFCIEWTGKLRKDGYGVVRLDGKETRAHRVALILIGKILSEKDIVLHTCDNPKCVNLQHLIIGTQADNLRDMRNKRRNKFNFKGINHPLAKLPNQKDIDNIKRMILEGITQKEIAKKYGIAQQTVSKINTNKRYA